MGADGGPSEPTTPATGLGYPIVASDDGLDEYGAPLPASVRAGNGDGDGADEVDNNEQPVHRTIFGSFFNSSPKPGK